jgi:EpsI family protein
MRKSVRSALMLVLMAATFALATTKALVIAPVLVANPINLEAMIPAQFDNWQWVPSSNGGVVNPQQDALSAKIYTQTLTRIYRNRVDGQLIMLSIAYGADQRDDLQVHYPEVCYPAQGFQVQSNKEVRLTTSSGDLQVRHMQTRLNASRNEPVTYWAMLGEQVVLDGVHKKLTEMRLAWDGKRADGLLFRVSTVDERNSYAFAGEARFISDLLASLPAADRRRLSGL